MLFCGIRRRFEKGFPVVAVFKKDVYRTRSSFHLQKLLQQRDHSYDLMLQTQMNKAISFSSTPF